mgnify:CR=1 FL=1
MKDTDAIGDVVRRIRRGSYTEACGIVMGLLGIKADLHAWALKHKQTVEGMDHHIHCEANFCAECSRPWESDDVCCSPDRKRGRCNNCPRGDALREIEELLK